MRHPPRRLQRPARRRRLRGLRDTRGRAHVARHARRRRRVAEPVPSAVVAAGVGAPTDPLTGMVAVTGVRVTPDLAEAAVYVSVLGGEKKRRATLAGLESAHGVLQSRIGRQLSLRRTPTLTFMFDPSV